MTAPHLRGRTPEELHRLRPDLLPEIGLARRVTERLVARDLDLLEGVAGLSAARETALRAGARAERLRVVDRRRSAVDPFVKYLFEASDGAAFEAVRIPLERPRWSVCVSSQAGCALSCAFCETGRLGLARHLEAWEIVEQVLTIRREGPERPVTGVVFQGQGEPLHNYDEVMHAAALLRHPNGLRIRGENITISTVGLLPAIERFVEEGRVHRLILSLTSAFDNKRAGLVPIARTYAVAELAAAMRRLAASRGGPVHVAWVLIAGVNTQPEEAQELAALFRGVPVRLHGIDVNDPTGRFRPPGESERRRFFGALGEHGIAFVRRYSGGPDIHAACGMLASAARGGHPLPSGETPA